MFKENDIIVTNNIDKKKILFENNKLLNIKIYTLNEFNSLYFLSYDEEALYYVVSKYKVNVEIAKIYLKNLLYIEDKEYKNEKLDFLKNLKKELLDNKLLSDNKLFRNSLKNRDIIFYNICDSKETDYLISLLSKESNVSRLNPSVLNLFKHDIYELDTLEDEVVFVAKRIVELIKKGVSISEIYLTNIDTRYRMVIRRIFKMFNIPCTLNDEVSINGTRIVNLFNELYESNISNTMTNLKEYVNEDSLGIYNKLVRIVNKYAFVTDYNDVKDLILDDIRNTNIDREDNLNSVHEVSLDDVVDGYLFVLGFNQGIIPTIYKDEDYLSDKDKVNLPLSLTIDLNNLSKKKVCDKLNALENVCITYKLLDDGEEFSISSINEILDYPVSKVSNLDVDCSNLYNKVKLTSLMDDYYKYGTKSDLLFKLNKHYKDLKYKDYNHKFSGISSNDLKEYLNNKLILSYSSLDKYYRCPFSFYLSNVLKLDVYEVEFYQLIGTLFHAMLEKGLSGERDFEELWKEEVNNLPKELDAREIFFLAKLKKELVFVMDTIRDQENFIGLDKELHEERVYTSISKETNVTFTGIIDKIKYKDYGDKCIVAIIDYKTGNPNLDLTTIPYGIGMQLPVYLYLAKNSPKFKHIEVAGFYLQKILNNEVTVDNSHSYQQLKKKNLLLQGYSNSNQAILAEFDHSYIDSNVIKSMKVTKDNNFYHYSKVLSSEEMDKITNIAEDKIKEGAKKILDGEFPIAPKQIGKNNYGCKFCKYKDICFMKLEDVEELDELKLDDILGRGE